MVHFVKSRLVLSYLSQFVGILNNIFLIPIVIQSVGLKEYGYIGIYMLLVGWVSLFEFGGSGVIARIFSNLKNNRPLIQGSFKAISRIYTIISLLIFIFSLIFMVYFYNQISIKICFLIALLLPFRLLETVTKSFAYATGVDKIYNIVFVIFSFIKFIVIYLCITNLMDINYYFFCQILSSLGILFCTYKIIAKKIYGIENALCPADFQSIFKQKKIILSLSFNALLILLTTQIDKIVLAKFVALEDIAVISSVMAIGGVIPLLTLPIMQLLTPRLILNHNSVFIDIRQFTRLLVIIPISSGTILLVYQDLILHYLFGQVYGGKYAAFYFFVISGFMLNTLYYLISSLQVAKNVTEISNYLCGIYIFALPFYIYFIPEYKVLVVGPYFLIVQIINVALGSYLTFNKIFMKNYKKILWWWWQDLLKLFIFMCTLIYLLSLICFKTPSANAVTILEVLLLNSFVLLFPLIYAYKKIRDL